ncbi:RNase H domain-containing protein [Trichonephila clavipes]|nr:RNase H domain-containing protein [Trichonephila clavipes]
MLPETALERINNVSKDAFHMYTDGSRLGRDSSGTGIYISFRDQEIKIQRKNSVFCSVFRFELLAILEGLNFIESLPQLSDIWIFSDSRSAIPHLANWHNLSDRTGADNLKILKRLSLSYHIHFQWTPSHVDIAGNEIVDSLARAGAGETTTHAAPPNSFRSIKQRISPFGWSHRCTHGIRVNALAAAWFGPAAADEIQLRLLVSLVVICCH